jgi:hypothetical protein
VEDRISGLKVKNKELKIKQLKTREKNMQEIKTPSKYQT